ncbi:THO complex subunit-like protein [Emericellopsis cladophorae]|uniref:THO complex subunit-like protein n=1 Tax=Emericellopsis cladophorae TaxID=2686198 RepID=A0A9P9Y919_9HYPO|nr:THO complex subunit-like protein [Emericellopsis cladophorae]KAI6785701.1 THO complex subunit-like protein [Emericellopsis cladophorae]
MNVDNLITDQRLHSILQTSHQACDQAHALVDLIDQNTSDTLSATQKAEISKQQSLLLATVAQLRGLNRHANLAARDTKAVTLEARQTVDKLHLQLQNLYYEQNHLQDEIAACESYDHKYRQLPLMPVDEFLAQYPDQATDDENALLFARIDHERVERETLENQRQELLKRKQKLIADNKRRKEDLANLDNDLEKFIDAAKPIQKLFEKEA